MRKAILALVFVSVLASCGQGSSTTAAQDSTQVAKDTVTVQLEVSQDSVTTK